MRPPSYALVHGRVANYEHDSWGTVTVVAVDVISIYAEEDEKRAEVVLLLHRLLYVALALSM